MPEKKNKFYLTTPIYYVNARPHIGHAYTTIVADVLARRHRLLGDDTFFLTGTDEHGQKIERSAAAAGIAPQEFADQVSAEFEKLWKRMGITYDRFIRTTSPEHNQGVQKLWRELESRDHIYLDSYTGSYCVSDEAFVDAPAGTPCPDCGRLLEIVTEENYFFRLSAFQDKLLALIESNELKIENDARRNEVMSFVRGGLKDLSISRSSFKWGIPVPGNDKHVVYVWLDALANYMTAIGYGSDSANDEAMFERYWPADLHLVGKEIIRFHCVYWPAFLLAAELPLPKAITAHGWLLFDNSKMSKSKGNIVRTETILEAFGTLCPPLSESKDRKGTASAVPPSTTPEEGASAPEVRPPSRQERDLFASDILRYFLLREIPFGQDGIFSFEAMVTRYNADLANGYGNLVSRTLSMIVKYFDGTIPTHQLIGLQTPFGESVNRTIEQVGRGYIRVEIELVTRSISSLVASVDSIITKLAPWKLATVPDKRQELSDVLYTAAESIRIITALLYPIVPATTAKVWKQLGFEKSIEQASADGELNNLQWGGLKPGTKLGALAPIFPRADKGLVQIMSEMENPAPEQPETNDPSHPAAPPRTGSVHEPAGVLPVGGSTAATTHNGPTPSHTEAIPSGAFASVAAQTPITAEAGDTVPQITIDDFAKIELRVAEIKVAERIPKADKLLRLEVDLGPDFPARQILSGIAEWYTPEELIGRRIVVITNLAPRKMRGLESHGMLLAASHGEGGKPVLATFGEEIALGSRLK